MFFIKGPILDNIEYSYTKIQYSSNNLLDCVQNCCKALGTSPEYDKYSSVFNLIL